MNDTLLIWIVRAVVILAIAGGLLSSGPLIFTALGLAWLVAGVAIVRLCRRHLHR